MQASPNIRMSVKNSLSRMSLDRPMTSAVSPSRIIQTSFVADGNLNGSIAGVDEAKILTKYQTKDVEIERLNTTKFTLTNKVLVKDDIKKNIEMMKKRIEEQNYLNSLVESENSRQQEELLALRNEN
jgi:hypothetical protein